MSSPDGPAEHRPYAALAYRQFRYFAVGAVASNIGMQMMALAVSWQIWRLTGSAMALGLVGLVEVIPVVGLALPAGQLADRLSRRKVAMVASAVIALCAGALGLLSMSSPGMPGGGPVPGLCHLIELVGRLLGDPHLRVTSPLVPALYFALLVLGIVRAFGGPALQALLPSLVPAEAFSNAVTWNSSFFQLSAMVGPALGGLLVAHLADTPWQYAGVYFACAVLASLRLGCVWLLDEPKTVFSRAPVTGDSLLAGLRFVSRNRIILATITLDLFAVLFGGAVALLPMFADQILHVGPRGLGLLRAAPSVGALLMALTLAHRPPMRRAGPAMLWAVALFGVATIVFGLSQSFILSLLMLFATGAVDNISVVVRHTLVQVLTPDAMRGRVSAVNQVFISISNEVGALESGLTAAWFGPVLSVVGGGLGTILVVLAVAFGWPEVRRFGSLADARPVDGPVERPLED